MAMRRRSPVLLLCLCLTAYFGFHAVKGKHGLEARAGLVSRAERLGTELDGLVAVRRRLEREVALLSEQKPDLDYVEEVARGMLGYARPGDVVLIGRNAGSEGGRPASR